MRDDLFKIIRLDELRIPKCKMDSLVGWLADDGDDQRHFRTYTYHADHGKDKLLLSFLFSALNFRTAVIEKGEQKGQVKVPSLFLREDKDFYPNYYYYVEL